MSVWDDDVREQPAATQAVRRALVADEISHAWLVVGPPQVGQQQLGRALTMALNCEEAEAPDRPCEVCSRCARIRRGLHELLEEHEPTGAAYVVEDVREGWIRSASRSLTDGRRRVMRIAAADRMNEAAQNAFLKVLEEPPSSVVWLLEVEDAAALLDTVVSRCRRLNVVPWGVAALRERAREVGVEQDRLEAVARVALGSPRRVEDLAEPGMLEARDEHLRLFDDLATGGPGIVIPTAKQVVAWAKSRATPLKERHAAEIARYEEELGVDARGRGWPPGLKRQLQRRHERLERGEQQRALGLFLDHIATYLRDLLVIGSGGDEQELRELWHVLSRRHSELLGGLSPRFGIATDANGIGRLLLRAGPIASGPDAVAACKAMRLKGAACSLVPEVRFTTSRPSSW